MRLFGEIFIGMLYLPVSIAFLTASISTLLNNRQTISCSGQIDTLYNGTIDSQSDFANSYTHYCIMVISTSLVNNLPKIVTERTFISGWNMYRNMAIHMCNFSTTMDIGYGNCTPYYFQTAESIQICICSTSNCTTTYSTCQASVNLALSAPPPLLPVLIPSLANVITCPDVGVNVSAVSNDTLPMYSSCGNMNNLVASNISKCYTYTSNHIIMCGFFNYQGRYRNQQMAMIEGTYESIVYEVMQVLTMIAMNISGYYYYETSTSMAIIFPGGPNSANIVWCLCITNNCNVNLSTCTNTMNIPANLLSNNGFSSSTLSSSSTVQSTNSILSSVSTSLGLSTTISTTVLTTISRNSSPSTTGGTSRSFGNKLCFLHYIVTFFPVLSLSFSLVSIV